MSPLDLHLVDFLLHHLRMYRNWRSMKPQHFKQWKQRYVFELQFGNKDQIPFSLPGGIQIMLEKNNQLSFAIYQGFEEDELAFVQDFLQPGMGFLDIGANVGLFSLHAAKILNGSAPCIAVEPASKTRQKLEENLALNHLKQVQILPLAFSDTQGELPLLLAEDGFDAFHSFAQPFMGGQIGQEMVQTQTLDNWTQDNPELAASIRLVKLDVEGWEVKVLKGAANWLAQPNAPILLVEFTEANARQAGHSCVELSESLFQLGYTLFRYQPKTKTLLPEPPGKTYDYCNLLAIKDPNQVREQLNAK
ncbi:MAG: FkbM family methyltransferase [Bacteroidetes bacterium]|nr:FkbM family methyltransferase [Bacteroidota bacterium]